MRQVVQCFAPEFLDIELCVRFCLALIFQFPTISFCCEIAELHVIITVVDEISLKAGRRDFLDIDRHKGDIGRERIASLTFLGRGFVGDCFRIVNHVIPTVKSISHLVLSFVHQRLDATIVLADSIALFLFYSDGFCLNKFRRCIIFITHYDNIIYRERNLKAVFIFYEHNIFSLETDNLSPAGLTEKSYFITFLHISFQFRWL